MTEHLDADSTSPSPAQPDKQQPSQHPGGPAGIPPGFEDAINRVQQLEKQTREDPSTLLPLIQAYETLLERLQPEAAPLFYAALQFNRGKAYSDLPVGDRAANLTHAIACWQEALRFRTPEIDPFEYARTQIRIGNACRDLPAKDHEANLMRAVVCYQEALRFWTPKTTPEGYLSIQNLLATAYHDIATNDALFQALACYQEVLRFQADPLEYARTQQLLGDVHRQLETHDHLQQAILCYQEALRFWTAEHTLAEYVATWMSLGNAYRGMTGDETKSHLTYAIDCYQEALRCWLPGTTTLDAYAASWLNLGTCYFELPTEKRTENIQQAIACYKQALQFWTPATNPLQYARVQTNLGNAYGEVPAGDPAANLKQAIECYQEALHFRTPKAAPEEYATTLVNLGATYADLPTGNRADNLKHAIECYQEALRIWTPESQPLRYAWLQTSLGIAYNQLFAGKRSEHLVNAMDCFRKALRFLTPENAPESYARTQNALGDMYATLAVNDRDNLKQALVCYQEALRIWTPEHDPLQYAETLGSLGTTHVDLAEADSSSLEYANNLKQAIACYQEALRFLKPETLPVAYARIQADLGRVYDKSTTSDRVARASACYREALRILTPEVAPDQCRQLTMQLADLSFADGKWQDALDAYRVAMAIGENFYRTGLSAESKALSVIGNTNLYQKAAFAAVRCGDATEALLMLERGKTRLLSEALRLRVPRPAGVPDETWNGYEQAAAVLRTLFSGAMIPSISTEKRNPAQIYMAHQQALHTAQSALQTATAAVQQYAPGFLPALNLHSIQTLLPDPETTLIAFCITDRGSLGFLVSRDVEGVQVVEVPAFTREMLSRLFSEVRYTDVTVPDTFDFDTDDALNRLLLTAEARTGFAGGWMGAFQVAQSDAALSDTTWKATLSSTLAELGQQIIAPVLAALPHETRHIVFLPSAELFLFPLHAVPLSPDARELVCDRYQVSYAPSIEVLADSYARVRRRDAPELYAVINPTADLDFTEAEGATIARLFEKRTVDAGYAGTREHVIAGVHTCTYVHFACHGHYDWRDPPASGLMLSDGSLTLAELQDGLLDLAAARLVTLSACDSGITDVVEGSAQEYVGIPAGFLLAGVPCVVSSLWAVDDFSTALLMEEFYRRHLLQGQNIAEALQGAQRWLRTLSRDELLARIKESREAALRSRPQSDPGRSSAARSLALRLQGLQEALREDYLPEDCPFVHPYYWAAFVVSGAS